MRMIISFLRLYCYTIYFNSSIENNNDYIFINKLDEQVYYYNHRIIGLVLVFGRTPQDEDR